MLKSLIITIAMIFLLGLIVLMATNAVLMMIERKK